MHGIHPTFFLASKKRSILTLPGVSCLTFTRATDLWYSHLMSYMIQRTGMPSFGIWESLYCQRNDGLLWHSAHLRHQMCYVGSATAKPAFPLNVLTGIRIWQVATSEGIYLLLCTEASSEMRGSHFPGKNKYCSLFINFFWQWNHIASVFFPRLDQAHTASHGATAPLVRWKLWNRTRQTRKHLWFYNHIISLNGHRLARYGFILNQNYFYYSLCSS